MKNILLGTFMGAMITFVAMADKQAIKEVEDTDMLMAKSLETMEKVRAATQKADKVVVEKVTQLKEENQELKTQNEELKEEVKVLESVSSGTTAIALPFDILAILPDSTN
jgi:predicted RNase H-like nuclease (RuvC/YqgF family)